MKISCVTASYVADLIGYPGEVDWGLASQTITRAPLLETVEGILRRLEPAGLDGIEFWFPHVWPANLTPILAGEIQKRLAALGMVCCACAGSVGNPDKNPQEASAFFQAARLLDAPLIAGHFEAGAVPSLGRLCSRYGVRAAFENGSEKEVSEIETAIQAGNVWIGANLDTGNLAAQGGDPVQAIRVLGPRLLHVHLKDVPAVGSHQCVALGRGIIDMPGVFRELKSCGYHGWLSIEIETGDHDPTAEIIASAGAVRGWLSNPG